MPGLETSCVSFLFQGNKMKWWLI